MDLFEVFTLVQFWLCLVRRIAIMFSATQYLNFIFAFATFSCQLARAVNRFGGNVEIPSNVPDDARNELLPKLSSAARLSFPGESQFEEFTTRYSDYNRPTFSLSVAPATAEDAVEAVGLRFYSFELLLIQASQINYAKSRNMPFLVQSGGHGVTPTTQGVQNGMQISMRLMNSIHFNSDNSIVTVGGGTLTGEFTNATYARGREVSE